MADLLDHFLPTAGAPGFPEKIAVHTFGAALKDYAQGFTTRNEIVVFWDLDDAAEQNQLDAVIAQLDAIAQESLRLLRADEYETVLRITETGEKYQIKSEIATRLGL